MRRGEGLPAGLAQDPDGIDHAADAPQAGQPVLGTVVARVIDRHAALAGKCRRIAHSEEHLSSRGLECGGDMRADEPPGP